jgi:hypothetical protein
MRVEPMQSQLARLLPWLLLMASLAACSSSPNPVLYTVAPIPGRMQSGAPRVIALRGIGLPQYLERLPIVHSSESYRLDVMANDWWGEPLGAMLGRVLAEELGQRLPQSVVLSESGAVSTTPDATVELNIQRLDEDASGTLVLMAQVGVEFRSRRAPLLRNFRVAVPPAAPGVGAEVAAISAAFGQLADNIATMLASGSGA